MPPRQEKPCHQHCAAAAVEPGSAHGIAAAAAGAALSAAEVAAAAGRSAPSEK